MLPTPRISDSIDLGRKLKIQIPKKWPGDADAAGLRPHFESPSKSQWFNIIFIHPTVQIMCLWQGGSLPQLFSEGRFTSPSSITWFCHLQYVVPKVALGILTFQSSKRGDEPEGSLLGGFYGPGLEVTILLRHVASLNRRGGEEMESSYMPRKKRTWVWFLPQSTLLLVKYPFHPFCQTWHADLFLRREKQLNVSSSHCSKLKIQDLWVTQSSPLGLDLAPHGLITFQLGKQVLCKLSFPPPLYIMVEQGHTIYNKTNTPIQETE